MSGKLMDIALIMPGRTFPHLENLSEQLGGTWQLGLELDIAVVKLATELTRQAST
jgi:hypothetical protein